MILIDMQGYQSFSKKRGIGRYTLNFVKHFINLDPENIYLLFNKNFKDIQEDKKMFSSLLPKENIIEFASSKKNLWLEKASELAMEKLISDLNPDAILITSLIEGIHDNSITSIKKFHNIPTAVIFYDLIPLIHKETFLANQGFKKWYLEKLDNLKRSDLLLSISKSSKQEAIDYLNFNPNHIVNISSAVNIDINQKANFEEVKKNLGINKEYIMHVSACDERKNFEGLIKALGKTSIKNKYQLVFVCNANPIQKHSLMNLAKKYNVDLIITGYIEDDILHTLYENAKLMVFPSFHEGFGLPILEAMHFDTPTIGSNTSSIPEVIGLKDALFNPYDINDMAKVIEKTLTTDFYNKLKKHIRIQKNKFNWNKSAKKAFQAIKQLKNNNPTPDIFENTDKLIKAIAKLDKTNDYNLKKISLIVEENEKEILKKRIKSIRIEGPFDSSYSLALLNRETAKALKKLNYDVKLYSMEGFGEFEPNKDFLDKNPEIKNLITKNQDFVDLVSRNLYPPNVQNMIGKIKMLHHYAWEESGFVDEWSENFNQTLNCMSTLSSHVKKIMIDNGVYIPMDVSGCGVDHLKNIKSKRINIKTKDFVFLHISSCFPRKGIDTLLNAYEKAFSKKDNVTLIIKTFPNPHNNIEELLKEKQKNKNFPDVVLINKDLSPEEIKKLYEISDVLVAPSKAEGFGLPLAEAMLEGVGVITTNWGGQLDFCNKENSWLVDFEFEKAKTHFNLFNSVWAKIDEKDLIAKLKEAYKTPKKEIKNKAKKGAELLNKQFKWIDVTKRMLSVAKTFEDKKVDNIKIGWVSTWEIKCGIATYSKHLLNNFNNKPIIFSTYETPDNQSIKCWNIWSLENQDISLNNLYEKIKEHNINVIVIQFNYSFFDFNEFNNLIKKLKEDNIKIIVEFHSTKNDYTASPPKRLEDLKLNYIDRIFVHSINDLNRLKNLGYINNVTLFPHGVLDFKNNSKTDNNLIVTYGFFLPHKGLLETIKAMKILKDKGLNYRLKMINAEYPAEISKNLINEAKNLINKLDLNNNIELITEFLEDEKCLEEISKARLAIFPYKDTGESASGAVRYALSTNIDILVTPINIFNDVKECGFVLNGFEAEDIAKGIIKYFNLDKNILKEKKDYRTKWLEHHRYSHLGKKFENIIKSLYINE